MLVTYILNVLDIILLEPHSYPLKKALLSWPFYRWENWSSKGRSTNFEIIQWDSSRAGTGTQASLLPTAPIWTEHQSYSFSRLALNLAFCSFEGLGVWGGAEIVANGDFVQASWLPAAYLQEGGESRSWSFYQRSAVSQEMSRRGQNLAWLEAARVPGAK